MSDEAQWRVHSFDEPITTSDRNPADWVRSLVRCALATRLFPTGQIDWVAVDGTIVSAAEVEVGRTRSRRAVRLVLNDVQYAQVAELILRTAGLDVRRGGLRLVVRPAADSNETWERDL